MTRGMSSKLVIVSGMETSCPLTDVDISVQAWYKAAPALAPLHTEPADGHAPPAGS
jgi:hypothetical protein